MSYVRSKNCCYFIDCDAPLAQFYDVLECQCRYLFNLFHMLKHFECQSKDIGDDTNQIFFV